MGCALPGVVVVGTAVGLVVALVAAAFEGGCVIVANGYG